jgi:hypothetical protein
MFNKKTLIELPFVYTVNQINLGDKVFFAAGSERNYPAYLINPENNNLIKVADGPGGMMSIMPVPGRSDQLVSVMGLFPPFIGFEAGIYFHENKNENWTSKKVISLPFSHRCEILTYNGENHLFIATVSSHKDNPGDWSKPGELYHVKIEKEGSDNWQPELILNNLFRNHGMNKCVTGNMEVVCISGADGIFSIHHDVKRNWIVTQLFDHEVSEFSFFDLDNDGEDELVTIEPFHGNSLNIYKKNSGKWQPVYSSPLSFGHGLSAGKFQDQNIVVVGNRRDSGDLELHKFHNANKIEKFIVESNVGATQTKVVRYEGTDYILCSNQTRNEVALYY